MVEESEPTPEPRIDRNVLTQLCSGVYASLESKDMIERGDYYIDSALQALETEEPRLLAWFGNDDVIPAFAGTIGVIWNELNKFDQRGYPREVWLNMTSALITRLVKAVVWNAIIENERKFDLSTLLGTK